MIHSKILIIDDEDLFREDLASLLRNKGFTCETAATAEMGLEIIPDFYPDIVMTDIVMPGKSGIDLVGDILLIHPDCSVIIMTAFGSLETAVSAFRKGAVDYILKPIVLSDLEQKFTRLEENQRILRELRYRRDSDRRRNDANMIIGSSRPIQHVIELIGQVAPTRSNVLVTGNSGTGKELVARSVHEQSQSSQDPFVALNCSGFSEHLLESELFGHKKGSFTGAVKDKAGFFEVAGNGTIFLDEISEMPMSLQGKLLRVLEEKEYYPVGGTDRKSQNARIITATNKNLKELISKKLFREDLFYRIGVFEITLPTLRERKSDIPLLMDSFLGLLNREMKRGVQGFSSGVMKCMMFYDWPGNVRELKNVIERAIILCQDQIIEVEHLPLDIAGPSEKGQHTSSLKDAVRAFERAHITQVLKENDWNKEATARILNVNPSTLYRKMAELDIKAEQ